MGRLDAGMVHHLAATRIQFRGAAGSQEPAAPVGSQASHRPGLEIRMSSAAATMSLPDASAPSPAAPSKGTVGMICLIIAESAIFTIFIVAYLFYLGKSLSGPKPRDVLELPILNSICLLSSSATITFALRSLLKG